MQGCLVSFQGRQVYRPAGQLKPVANRKARRRRAFLFFYGFKTYRISVMFIFIAPSVIALFAAPLFPVKLNVPSIFFATVSHTAIFSVPEVEL